jgi:hypothetical protein
VTELYQGALAQETFVLNLVPADVEGTPTYSLSAVATASFEVMKPDGSVTSWTAAMSNQTGTTLTLTYSFHASTSELDQAGTYVIYAKLMNGAGKTRTTRRVPYLVRARREVVQP